MALLEGDIYETQKLFKIGRDGPGFSLAHSKRRLNEIKKILKEYEKEGRSESDPEVQKIKQEIQAMKRSGEAAFVHTNWKNDQKQKMKAGQQKENINLTPMSKTPDSPSSAIQTCPSIKPKPPGTPKIDKDEDNKHSMHY